MKEKLELRGVLAFLLLFFNVQKFQIIQGSRISLPNFSKNRLFYVQLIKPHKFKPINTDRRSYNNGNANVSTVITVALFSHHQWASNEEREESFKYNLLLDLST